MALLLQISLIVPPRQLGIIPSRITTLRLALRNSNTIPSSSSSLHKNRLYASMASTAQKVKNTFQTKNILN